jgi:hypothetical protein
MTLTLSDNTLSSSISYNATNLKLTTNALNTIQDIATTSSPSFAGLTLSGSTASRGLFTDANKALTTTGTLGLGQGGTGLDLSGTVIDDGEILIGRASDRTLVLNTITAGNQIGVTNGAGAITVAVSTTPSFTTVNGLSFTANTDGFTISGGTTSRSFTLAGDAFSLNLSSPQNTQIIFFNSTSGKWENGTLVGSGGMAAAPDATYITQTASAGLSNEQALSSLSTGLMKVTNGTGVVTSITDNSTNWDAGYTYRFTSASGTSPLTLTLATNGLTGSIAYTGNLKVTTNQLDTIQGITTTSTPQFGKIGLGTAASTALVTLASGTTSANGIDFGGDTTLYRSAANTLKTDDTFVIDGASLDLKEGSAPSATTGYGKLYAATDNSLHFLDEAGADSNLLAPVVQELTKKFTVRAGDTLEAGDLVSYVNGEVAKGRANSLGTTYSSSVSRVDQLKAVALSATKIAIAYSETTGSEYGKAIIGEVSGNTITWGSSYTFNSTSDTTGLRSITNIGSDKIAIAWSHNYALGKVIIGTVSGTVISFGSATNFLASNPGYVSIISPSANKIAISYSGYTVVASVSGTTPTFGTPSRHNTENGEVVLTKISDDKIIVAFTNGSVNYGKARIGTISGTTISGWGDISTFSDTGAAQSFPAVLNSGKVLISYKNKSDGYHKYVRIGTISGTTISGWGDASEYSTSGDTKMAVISENTVVALNGNDCIVGTISGTSMSWGAATAGGLSSEGVVVLSGNIVVATGSKLGYIAASVNTVMPYIGVAQTPCSAGTSCPIDFQGRISGLTGLTSGSTYYAGASGDLTTTAYPDRVGVALSETDLMLDGNFGSGTVVANSVGVGLSAPTASIHVSGMAGKVGLQIDSNETTATNNTLVLTSDLASVSDPIFRVQADGAVYADGAYTGTGADYAEYFENEEIIPVKSLVGLNPGTGKVRKYITGDTLIGVVSEKPGFVGNSTGDVEHNSNYTLVALVGQVSIDPEMITVESGVVKSSDGVEVGRNLASGKVLLSIRDYSTLADAGDPLGGEPTGVSDSGSAFGLEGGLYWNKESKLLGLGSSDPKAKLEVVNSDVSVKGMIIKSATGQVANLAEWQDSAGALLLAVTADGKLSFGGRANLYKLADGVIMTDGSLKVNENLEVAGSIITKPSDVQLLNATMQIDPKSAKIKVVGSGQSVTLTSQPSVKPGEDGQMLIIQGADDSSTVTLLSETDELKTGLMLGQSERILGKGDILSLTFDKVDSVWYEINYSNN